MQGSNASCATSQVSPLVVAYHTFFSLFYSHKNCILTLRVCLLPFQNHAFSLQQCSHKPYPTFSLHVGFLLGKTLRESRSCHITLFLIPNNTKLASPTFLWYLLLSLLFKSSDSTQGHFISSGTNAFTLLSGCLRFLSIFLEKCVHSPRCNQANVFARPMSNEIVAIYIMCSSGILLLFHGFTFLLAFLWLLPGRLQQSKHLTMYRQHVLRKNNLLPYSKCLFSKQTHHLTFILLVVYFFISFAKLTKK